MPTDACRDAISQLLKKDLASWHGLPPHCALDALAALEFGEEETSAVLGEARAPATYRRARAAGYAETWTIWLRGEMLVRISVRLPALPDVPGLQRALGAPEAKLDAWRATVAERSPEAEWVWPARGLALVMSSDRSNVMELVAFPPTTLDDYRAQLRFDDAPREHEL
jgi:hypothetical protein